MPMLHWSVTPFTDLQFREGLHPIQPALQELREPPAELSVVIHAALFVLAIHFGRVESIQGLY
jgi:hypothetical protein